MPILSNPFIGSFRSPCQYNGDVVSHHNRLRVALFESCRQPGVGGNGSRKLFEARRKVYTACRYSSSELGCRKTCSFDLTVTSLLIQSLALK